MSSIAWHTTRNLPDVLTWRVFTASQNVGGAARGGAQKQASRLCAIHDLRRVTPSTRGATAPQGAQQVKFCCLK
jgi:hypothetical protein